MSDKPKTDNSSNQPNSTVPVEGSHENFSTRLIGIKINSTTSRVTSASDPDEVHAIVKILHPSMLLAD